MLSSFFAKFPIAFCTFLLGQWKATGTFPTTGAVVRNESKPLPSFRSIPRQFEGAVC
jgi:hypothetical protein